MFKHPVWPSDQEKLKALQEEKKKLYDNWQSKQKWLESTYLEQVFYRDTEYMEKITNSQEVRFYELPGVTFI